MRLLENQVLNTVHVAGVCLLCVAQPLSARHGQGNMTVSPASVKTGSTNNVSFSFRASKNAFSAGSQATLLIPAGWSAPQTNNASGQGFVTVTPVLSKSTASLVSLTGSGPWTLTISFSVSQNQGGFNINYQGDVAPTNAGVYSFTAKSEPSGGVLAVLRSGSPSITVNSPVKTNTTTSLSSALNPSNYGDWVPFTAAIGGAGPGTLTGTVTFKDADVVLGIAALDSQGRASFSTNRLSVPESPCWLTAVYSGDLNFNGSVSTVLLQTVNPATLILSGLAANDKVYDGGTGASLDTSSVSLGGLVSGDAVTLDTSGAIASFADPNAGVQKAVNVGGLALLGVDSGSYTLGPAPAVSADILPALLVVTANDTNRLFGAPNPAFTATYSGFVAGEGPLVLGGTPAFSTTANAASPAAGSPYPIVVTNGTLTATNYSFLFVPGSLTVTPGPGQPQKIISIVKLSDGTVALGCAGAAGQTYLLQAASSLSSGSWTTIATNTTDVNGLMTCIDQASTNLLNRFYRTSLP